MTHLLYAAAQAVKDQTASHPPTTPARPAPPVRAGRPVIVSARALVPDAPDRLLVISTGALAPLDPLAEAYATEQPGLADTLTEHWRTENGSPWYALASIAARCQAAVSSRSKHWPKHTEEAGR